MSGESGSARWVWGAALVLIVTGVVSVATAVAAYVFWWRPLQQAALAAIPSPTPPPLPPVGGDAGPDVSSPPSVEVPAAGPGAEPEPGAAGPEAASPGSAAGAAPVARPASTPLPTPAPPVARGSLLVEIEAAQDPHSPEAVAAMRFEVRLDGQRIGTVGVPFGARGVQRQNGRGRVEIEGLAAGPHELTISGGPEGGRPVRGATRIVLEAGRNRAYARVRYLSATDREVRFR
jgi:hypothetical protein